MTLGEIALWSEINTLNWVLDEIKFEIDKLKPTPIPSKEGKNISIYAPLLG